MFDPVLASLPHCRFAVALLLLVVSTACGDSKSTPTEPTVPPESGGSGASPVVKFELKGDELGSRDPIAMLSEVSVDASASTGTGSLTYTIDFGDSTKSPGPVARHTFQAAGTYTISVEARDAQGRQGMATQQVVVKAVTGGWYHAAYNPNAKMVEVRRLTITGQDGLTIRGVFAVNGQPDRAFSATLTKPRNVQIVVNSAISLEGTIPSRLNDDGGTWPLQMRGETVDAQRLDFRAAVGDPSSPGPDAVLQLQAPNRVIAGVPAEFDASASRGSGLSYFLDFGDGQSSAQNRAVHAFTAGYHDVELTAVDGLGRYNRERVSFTSWGLQTYAGLFWDSFNGPTDLYRLAFSPFDGESYSGVAQLFTGKRVMAVGTIGPNGDVWIALSSGVEYRGHFESTGPYFTQLALVLTQYGGSSNGVTFKMFQTDGH